VKKWEKSQIKVEVWFMRKSCPAGDEGVLEGILQQVL